MVCGPRLLLRGVVGRRLLVRLLLGRPGLVLLLSSRLLLGRPGLLRCGVVLAGRRLVLGVLGVGLVVGAELAC